MVRQRPDRLPVLHASPSPTDAQTIEAWTAAPGPRLQPYVAAYMQLVIGVPAGREAALTQSASVEPLGCVTWSGGIRIGGREAAHPVSIVGPITAPLRSRFSGSAEGFFVRFTPVGLRALLGVRGAEYRRIPPFDRAVPVTPGVAAWGQRVTGAADFEARVALTETWLAGELTRRDDAARDAGRDAGTAFAEAAVALIDRADGVLRVDALADALGVSTSTLRRRFVAELGIAPKTYCEIVRLRRAHAFLLADADATWADAVVRFGYSDQAHLVHAYARYAGVSPTRWTPHTRAMDLAFGMGSDLVLVDAPAAPARFLQEPGPAGVQLGG